MWTLDFSKGGLIGYKILKIYAITMYVNTEHNVIYFWMFKKL